MKNTTIAGLIAAPLMVLALALPSWADDPAPTTCKDGTTTTSTGKGTCSGHGGVQKAPKTAATAAPAAAPTPAKAPPPATAAPAAGAAKATTASATDPTGATAKCKDGTFSHSQHHSGSCSSHGGVAEWLTAQ